MRKLIMGIAALMLVAAACGGDEPSGAGAVELKVTESEVGSIITLANERTVYVFTQDTGSESTCYDSCEENWPPLVATAAVEDSLDASLLGTTERTDGRTQVTYNGQPLYRYSGDTEANQVNGQGVGGAWFTLSPTGEINQ